MIVYEKKRGQELYDQGIKSCLIQENIPSYESI